MITKTDAVHSLVSACAFSITEDGIITWIIPTEAPVTDEEINAELARLQEEEKNQEQAQADAKQAALNKLMALGLTEEEALALGVKQ